MVLETERLILRPFTVDDFDAFAAMYADPRVAQFVTEDGKPLSRFGAWRAMAGIVGHWTLRGFGLFAVVERSSGTFVGRIGPWDPEGWPDFEVGWTLCSEYWGRGYATEAVKRCIDYSFTDLDRSHISSFIAPENTRSIRVAERVGERLEGDTVLPHMPDRKVLQYGLAREDWQRRDWLKDAACRVEAESEHAAAVKTGNRASEASASTSVLAFELPRISSDVLSRRHMSHRVS